MAKVKIKESIYDIKRSGNPFRNGEDVKQENTSGGKTFLKIVFMLVVMPIGCLLAIGFAVSHGAPTSMAKSSTPVTPINVNSPTTMTSVPPVSSVTNKKLVSKADRAFLDSFTIISNNSQVISKQNLIPVEQTKLKIYKAFLLNAIVLCDNETKKLSETKPSAIFQPIANLTMEYIANRRNTSKYYLEYIVTGQISNIDIGNKYTGLANQNSQEFKPLLTQILKDNNYEFTVSPDGQVNYFVEK